MTRTVDLESRARLLDRISLYIVKHGLHDLSLRPLAAAVDSSPRMLLYHFGSKEDLVSAVLRRTRERQMEMFEKLCGSELMTEQAVHGAVWATMSDPKFAPYMILFFEAYSIALRDPKRFPGFLERAVEDWLEFLSPDRTIATIKLAGYRGFMLDLAATGDRKRIAKAVDAWIDSLALLTAKKGYRRAQ